MCPFKPLPKEILPLPGLGCDSPTTCQFAFAHQSPRSIGFVPASGFSAEEVPNLLARRKNLIGISVATPAERRGEKK